MVYGGDTQLDKDEFYYQDLLEPSDVLHLFNNNPSHLILLDLAYRVQHYKEVYKSEHIDGAYHFDVDPIVNKTVDGVNNFTHINRFEEYMRSMGINENSRLILCDHGEVHNAMVISCFVWRMMKTFGCANVYIVNGGLRKWKFCGYPTTSVIPSKLPIGNFTAKYHPEFVADVNLVRSLMNHPSAIIIDTRSPEEFQCLSSHWKSKSNGKITGSTHWPTNDLLEPDGSLKPLHDICNSLPVQLKSYDSCKEYIGYCNTGTQTSANFFVWNQLQRQMKVYDGSWIEWSHRIHQ